MAKSAASTDSVCESCKTLTVDILSGRLDSTRWRTIESEYGVLRLSYMTGHLDGTVAALERSARDGCPSCCLLRETVAAMDFSRSAWAYYIVVWLHDRFQYICQFAVSIDVQELVEGRGDSKIFQLFVQPTTALVAPELRRSHLNDGKRAPAWIYMPNRNSGSPPALQQARKWLKECQTLHAACIRHPNPLPKRVLDLGDLAEALKVSLYITRRELQPYATFSYSWGQTNRLVTRRASVADSEADSCAYVVELRVPDPQANENKLRFRGVATHDPGNIPLDAFPRAQRDALHIVKALGFRYLWIDSLCILQGDEEDWQQQGAAMTEIYGRSTINISASGNINSNQEMLGEVLNRRVRLGVWYNRATDEQLEVFVGEPNSDMSLENQFLSTRGWVFQERLVSTATLHYTNEGMIWECAQGTWLERDQKIIDSAWKRWWRSIMEPLDPNPSISGPRRPTEAPYHVWYQWMSAYSARDLYRREDKFPAIAGVAKTFAEVFGLTPNDYCAGLWKTDLIRGLLWSRSPSKIVSERRLDPYVAPSWSWASVQGPLEYRCPEELVDSPNKGPTLKVIEAHIKMANPKMYGVVMDGRLVVEGWVQEVEVDRQKTVGFKVGPNPDRPITQGFANPVNVSCMLDGCGKEEPRYHRCWCLRVGSYDHYDRELDFFLLLDRVGTSDHEYRRIGLAETAIYSDSSLLPPDPDQVPETYSERLPLISGLSS